MFNDELEDIITKFDSDREFIVSDAYPDGGDDPLFPRLLRAAGNQASQGPAAIPRYAIWANTVRDNIRMADREMRDGNFQEAHRLLCRAANSLSAFSEIQACFDTVLRNRKPA